MRHRQRTVALQRAAADHGMDGMDGITVHGRRGTTLGEARPPSFFSRRRRGVGDVMRLLLDHRAADADAALVSELCVVLAFLCWRCSFPSLLPPSSFPFSLALFVPPALSHSVPAS